MMQSNKSIYEEPQLVVGVFSTECGFANSQPETVGAGIYDIYGGNVINDSEDWN